MSAFDIDLETLEEQPWRKSGVDLALYFNYGFNEATFLDYAEKQLRYRMEDGKGPTIYKPKEMVPSKEQTKSEIPKGASDAQIAFQEMEEEIEPMDEAQAIA